MKAEFVNEMVSLIEAHTKSRPSPIEFEMAYQVRVAIDRIRFAIKTTEQSAGNPRQLQEAGLQLLDALDRLESADRDFQTRFRRATASVCRETRPNTVNGNADHTDSRWPA